MGWSIGHDSRWGKYGRDIGYGVPATCDHPGCGKAIDRGLSYVCGGDAYGGEHGCGLHFCGDHLHFEDRGDECPQLCERCAAGEDPFEPTADTKVWVAWKLTDESWAKWRAENPEEVAAMRVALSSEAPPIGAAGEAEAALQQRMSPNPPPPHPIGNGNE